MDMWDWEAAGGLLLATAVDDAALLAPAGAPPVIVVPRDWDEARRDQAVSDLARALVLRHGPALLVALLALAATASAVAIGHGAALVHLADLRDTVAGVGVL